MYYMCMACLFVCLFVCVCLVSVALFALCAVCDMSHVKLCLCVAYMAYDIRHMTYVICYMVCRCCVLLLLCCCCKLQGPVQYRIEMLKTDTGAAQGSHLRSADLLGTIAPHRDLRTQPNRKVWMQVCISKCQE